MHGFKAHYNQKKFVHLILNYTFAHITLFESILLSGLYCFLLFLFNIFLSFLGVIFKIFSL